MNFLILACPALVCGLTYIEEHPHRSNDRYNSKGFIYDKYLNEEKKQKAIGEKMGSLLAPVHAGSSSTLTFGQPMKIRLLRGKGLERKK